MANIVITTHWTDGDIIPFIRIGSALRERGHKVTLITHCYYESMAKSRGLCFEALDSPEQYMQMVDDMKEELDPVKNRNAFEKFKQKYESIPIRVSEYKKVAAHCNAPNTVLLAKNRSSVAALLAAEKLSIPLVYVFMAPSEMLSMIVFEMLYGQVLAKELNLLRKEVELPPVESWLSWQSSAKRQIALWPHWFAKPEAEWPSEVINVGFPVPKEENLCNIPGELKEMLGKDKPPVIITGGTSKMIHPEFYPLSAEACRLSGHMGILVTRYEELVPKNLPDGIRWFKDLPLNSILPYTSAVIHHGGMGTLSGAIAAGVPQLVLAYNVDRPYNAACLKKLGIAEYLPPIRWTPDILADSLRRIDTTLFRERCKAFSKQVSDNDAIDKTCSLIEEVIGNKSFIVSYNKCYQLL